MAIICALLFCLPSSNGAQVAEAKNNWNARFPICCFLCRIAAATSFLLIVHPVWLFAQGPDTNPLLHSSPRLDLRLRANGYPNIVVVNQFKLNLPPVVEQLSDPALLDELNISRGKAELADEVLEYVKLTAKYRSLMRHESSEAITRLKNDYEEEAGPLLVSIEKRLTREHKDICISRAQISKFYQLGPDALYDEFDLSRAVRELLRNRVSRQKAKLVDGLQDLERECISRILEGLPKKKVEHFNRLLSTTSQRRSASPSLLSLDLAAALDKQESKKTVSGPYPSFTLSDSCRWEKVGEYEADMMMDLVDILSVQTPSLLEDPDLNRMITSDLLFVANQMQRTRQAVNELQQKLEDATAEEKSDLKSKIEGLQSSSQEMLEKTMSALETLIDNPELLAVSRAICTCQRVGLITALSDAKTAETLLGEPLTDDELDTIQENALPALEFLRERTNKLHNDMVALLYSETPASPAIAKLKPVTADDTFIAPLELLLYHFQRMSTK